MESEGMTREEFIQAYTGALRILGNVSADELIYTGGV
jgi:hypothetical protein